ncbi:ead/Ea22-like family protein [Salmonella enterica subsp. enterica serovar Praha]|nr:ead/Ea22-like family protein [Salmonella enterica]EBQ6115147.1 ead/Ea22-like family protein [Salmonella enterica subsp. enterica serovar Praha]EAV4802343.1 ead/Ea22-like family protein [Salmonella enterica]EBJ6122578.1 ead/Ea22-like family protein [Salmonella enterica]EBO4026430.1 ead/Ea22-like family protein [Salmonella enterica]
MSNIDKQVLREEFRFMQEHYSDPADRARQVIYIAAEALLDENIQLQREKDVIEAVALALRDDMRQAREQLEAAEKRNAEQREYYEGVIADGSKRIAELEARKVNLSKLSVGEVMHMSGFSRDYAEGWCAGNDNAIHEIRTAGIKVKES